MTPPHFLSLMMLFWAAISLSFLPGEAYASSPSQELFEATSMLPAAHEGRIRPLDATARLWLHELAHANPSESSSPNLSPLDMLWSYHFLGHRPFDDLPLFHIHLADIKKLLHLPLKSDRFSLNQLKAAFADEATNLPSMRLLILHAYAADNKSAKGPTLSPKRELVELAKGLWVTLKGDDLIILKAPSMPPWHFLKSGMIAAEKVGGALPKLASSLQGQAGELLTLMQRLQKFESHRGIPLKQKEKGDIDLLHRLNAAGSTLKMLPSRLSHGEWHSLHALNLEYFDKEKDAFIPIGNFTLFSDAQYEKMRSAYLAFEDAATSHFLASPKDPVSLKEAAASFASSYEEAYRTLAGIPYHNAHGKSLSYPSASQLKAESLYHKWPLVEAAALGYLLALLSFAAGSSFPSLKKVGIAFASIGFLFHTALLLLRCYILQRPPVSNMFETVIYVPWIALLLGFFYYLRKKLLAMLIAGTCTGLILLIILKVSKLDARLDNVQAVLDSQYWLIVHVLMVVGSYGAFIMAGVLAHLYLARRFLIKGDAGILPSLATGILHALYIGLSLLIAGTLLGGVWAAESWGRFWDWDPKESWAFISICTYLIIVHAYSFGRCSDKGLAIGAIFGLMAISFTWYGVNYMLGMGLHSYGFGHGGQSYYLSYIALECMFLAAVLISAKRDAIKNSRKSAKL